MEPNQCIHRYFSSPNTCAHQMAWIYWDSFAFMAEIIQNKVWLKYSTGKHYSLPLQRTTTGIKNKNKNYTHMMAPPQRKFSFHLVCHLGVCIEAGSTYVSLNFYTFFSTLHFTYLEKWRHIVGYAIWMSHLNIRTKVNMLLTCFGNFCLFLLTFGNLTWWKYQSKHLTSRK